MVKACRCALAAVAFLSVPVTHIGNAVPRELQRRGHTLRDGGGQGVAQVIIYNAADKTLEGGTDRRVSDGAAVAVVPKR